MKNAKYLKLLTICLGVVLLVCSLSGCMLNKDDDSEASGQSESGTLGGEPATSEPENDELSDQLSFAFEYLNARTGKWEAVSKSKGSIFGDDEFEPGYVKVVYFRINNTSKIGFDWALNFGFYEGDMKLAEVIKVLFNVSDTELHKYPDNRQTEGYSEIGSFCDLLIDETALHESFLASGETVYFGVMLEMDSTAGSEYQGRQLDDVTLRLTATERLLFATCTDEDNGDGFAVAVENSGADFKDVLPGDLLNMTTSVRNTGSYEQYVRLTVTVSDISAFRQDMGAEWSAESLFEKPTWADDSVMVLDSVSVKDDCAVFVFYLNKLLASGESIVLYEGVSMPAELTANTVGTTSLKDGFTVKVFAEAVFTSNTAIENAKSAFEYAASKQ